MAFWIWILISLFIIIFLSSYIKARVIIKIQEDKSYQGISLEITSRFYKTKRQYDYTDPNFRLIESILISAIGDRMDNTKAQNTSSNDCEDFRRLMRDFPVKALLRLSAESYKTFNNVLKHTVVEKIEWISTVGSKDALMTALSTGVCWAFKGTLIGVLSSKCRLGHINLDVKPDFTTPAFLSTFTCILKIRMVHIIIIETHAIVIKVRWCMNGFTARTAESSH